MIRCGPGWSRSPWKGRTARRSSGSARRESPIPTAARSRHRTAAQTTPRPGSAPTEVVTPRIVRTAKSGGRRALLVASLVLVLGAGAALAMWQPWKPHPGLPTTPGAEPDPAAGTSGGPAVPTSDSAVVPTTTQVQAPAPQTTPPASQVTKPPAGSTRPNQRPGTPAETAPAAASVAAVLVVGPAALTVGEAVTLDANPADAGGRMVQGRSVAWSSSSPECWR